MKNLFFLALLFTFFGFSSCAQQSGNQASQHIAASEVNKLVQENPDLVILDVRTPQEFSKGHLQRAKNIDFYDPDFEKQITKLDNSKTYLVYCASGNRSGKATNLMEKNNFDNIYNSTAGFSELKSAGLPVK